MKAVAIDIGNSSIKLGYFEEGKLLELKQVGDLSSAKALIDSLDPQQVVTCSVSYTMAEQKKVFSDYDVLYFDHDTPLPITNHYQTPKTLGLDRLAAVAGAEHLFGGRDCLVIDMGTCITYDYMDAGRNYWGGSISPGIELRFKSMNDYTKNLPLIKEYGSDGPLTANSTTAAMISGVLHGIAAEVQGIIAQYQQKSPDLQVLLCGGSAKRFESKLKAPIFAAPELVLVGLTRILEYNSSGQN